MKAPRLLVPGPCVLRLDVWSGQDETFAPGQSALLLVSSVRAGEGREILDVALVPSRTSGWSRPNFHPPPRHNRRVSAQSSWPHPCDVHGNASVVPPASRPPRLSPARRGLCRTADRCSAPDRLGVPGCRLVIRLARTAPAVAGACLGARRVGLSCLDAGPKSGDLDSSPKRSWSSGCSSSSATSSRPPSTPPRRSGAP